MLAEHSPDLYSGVWDMSSVQGILVMTCVKAFGGCLAHNDEAT
jgi:hypothetical protein